jgi:glycosidase
MTLMMTSRGTPILYYGDEWAMAGGEDPDNRRDFPGGFPGDARNAFDPAGREPSEQAVWKHIANLGALRKKYPALAVGQSLDLLDAEQQYAYARVSDRHTLIVVLNNDTEPATIEFDTQRLTSQAILKGWSFQCDDLLGGLNRLTVQVEASNLAPNLTDTQKPQNNAGAQAIASLTLPARTSAVFLLPE